MKTDRIDFISSYCDRWCERCAYTARCSAYATKLAIAMCGDVAEGIELAVGAPRSPDGSDRPVPDWLAGLEISEPTDAEMADWSRREKARRARTGETAAMKVAWAVSTLAHRWFTARLDAITAGADPVLADALEIAQHDDFLIPAKLGRALNGRDRAEEDDEGDDDDDDDDDGEEDRIQKDWNGSAKVALISIERSEAAWRVIAEATREETPLAIANQLRDLRALVEETFPHAWAFVRPGFDEPDR